MRHYCFVSNKLTLFKKIGDLSPLTPVSLPTHHAFHHPTQVTLRCVTYQWTTQNSPTRGSQKRSHVLVGSHLQKWFLLFLFNHTTPFSTKGLDKSLFDFTGTIIAQCENPVHFH